MGCILRAGSVNLNKCRVEAPMLLGNKKLNINNVYVRFIRFFKINEIGVFCLCLAQLSLDSLRNFQENTYLIIDRSNWKLGRMNRNILQVGLTLSNGLMVPIFGVPLDKRGNSNESERIKLLDIVLKLCKFLGKGDILLADREFIGKKWIAHLLKCGLSFIIRLRKDDYLADIALSNLTTVEKLVRKIERKVRANGFYFTKLTLDDKQLFLVVVKDKSKGKNSKDGYVRLLSDLSDIEQIILAYKQRWQIEVYFAKTKKKGFNLEDIGLEDFEKVMLMATIVGYLYTLALMEGITDSIKKPEKLQYFLNRNKKYPRASVFLNGLTILKSQIFSIKDLSALVKRKIPRKERICFKWLRDFLGKSIFDHVKSV